MKYLSYISSALIFLSFLTSILAIAGPWLLFKDPTGMACNIGLWVACRNDICKNAWNQNSPLLVSENNSEDFISSFQYSSMPPLIQAASILYILGYISTLGIGFCYEKGVLGIVLAAILYSFAYGCASSFFLLKSKALNIYEVRFAYAFFVGMVGLCLIWTSLILILYEIIYSRSKKTKLDTVHIG